MRVELRSTAIPWLEGTALPAHWRETKVKYLTPGMCAGEAITAEGIEESGSFPVYGGNGLRGFAESFSHSGIRVLIGRQGALCGNVRLVSGDFWASEHAIVAEAARDVDPRWLAYLLRVMNLGQYSQTSAQPGIGTAQIGALSAPLPSAEEQRAIADFLDRETAQIDELVAEQQRLIELLRERRQAAIDQTVDFPTSQKVQLRRAIKFLTSGSRGWGDFYADTGERFLRIGNLPRTTLAVGGEVQHVALPSDVTEGERTRLQANDLLFSITAYLGSVAVVDDEWVDAYVSQHVALCRLDQSQFESRFVGFVMLSTGGQNQLKEGAAGGTKLQLALDDIRHLVVPLVSLDEQRRVVFYLDEQTARTDRLIGEAERLIELAHERRAALITAAATGQINVRSDA